MTALRSRPAEDALRQAAASPFGALASAAGVYVLSRVLRQTLYTLLALASVLLTIQLLNIADLLIQARSPLRLVAVIAISLVPGMMIVMLPIALLIGAVRAFHALAENSELVAMEALGASRRSLCLTILAVSLALGGACLGLSLYLEPLGNKTQRDIINALQSGAIRLLARPGELNQVNGQLFVRVSDWLPDGGLKDFLLIDGRDPKVQKIYSAKVAYFVGEAGADSIYFLDGVLFIKNVQDRAPSRISFADYTLALDPQSPDEVGAADARRKTTSELLSSCADSCSDARTAVEIHRRFSDWLNVFAFGAIAFFFVERLRLSRGARPWTLFAALPTAIVVRGCEFLLVSQSAAKPWAAAMVFAFPLGVAAVFVAAALARDSLRWPFGRSPAPPDEGAAPLLAGGRR